MAGPAPALYLPLHTDLVFVAQRRQGSSPNCQAATKRGVFRCVVDLQATINRFVAETNHDPKPFT